MGAECGTKGELRILYVPLLDFVKSGEERDGDEDDDGFLAMTDLELYRKASISKLITHCSSNCK